jgi:transposase-like protein
MIVGQGNFTEDFRLDAIKQITERGHSVTDVSKRLGVSTHSLYSWMKRTAYITQRLSIFPTLPKLIFVLLR